MNIYRYTVETEMGESEPFDTYAAANERAMHDHGKVIEYEFEFADSHMVADYTENEGEHEDTD